MSLSNTPEVWVNGRKISASKIDEEMQYHPAANHREAMINAAESLIIAEVVLQRAAELKLIEAENYPKPEEEQRIIDELIKQEVHIPQASTAECKRYYHANREKFVTAPLIEAKHILLAADPEDLQQREQSKILAEKLVTLLQSGLSSFGELARQYSACPSKELGGSLGQLSQGQTVPEFQRQLFAAAEGLMATPIETRFGFHVVLVEKKIVGNSLPYHHVQDKIKQFLNDKVQHKAISQYLQRLVAKADIKGFSFVMDCSSLMQ